jgi:hypothetical protein
MRMLLAALVAMTAASVAAQGSSAGAKPWCAQIYDRGGDGGRTCGYVSWEQMPRDHGPDGGILPAQPRLSHDVGRVPAPRPQDALV